MNILGLDNGYNFTKTSMGVKILSTIKNGVDDINKDILQVNVNGTDYIMDEANGRYVADADKLKTEESKEVLKVCSLVAIGLSYPGETNIEVEIVAGLPVDFFSRQKEEFKKELESYNDTIFINKLGKEQHIRVVKATIFPQSAGVVFQKAKELKNTTSLVIDIGGGTWDISQFDGLKMVKKRSYQEGMLVMYSKIAQYLNTNYYTSFNSNDIFDLMRKGFFTADGQKVNINVVDHIIKDHTNKIITDIKRDFDPGSVDNKFLIGGGTVEVGELVKLAFPGAIIEADAQNANAECFEFMGRMRR